ncbi:S8 family serine peptidase [Haloferax sp. DFSO52]|uniref:S8 family serine peptidase n=1 Tax=Haloferax sp. DFSO52 TaxID=3388505 RepID=UPI003A867972
MNERLDNLNVSRRTVLRTVGTGLAGVGLAGEVTGQQPPGRYIVGTRSKKGVRAARASANAVEREFDFGDIGFAVSGRFSQQALDALAAHADVRYVEPDGAVEAIGEELPWGVDRIDADVAHSAGQTGAGAHVAILDTGIDADHPDLQANLGDGYAVESCRSGCTTAWDDDNDHGTHCAGIVGAVDNTEGTIGVTTEGTIHAVKVLGRYGAGTWSGVVDGLMWVVERGYDVASMSFGATSASSTLRDACQYAYDNGVLLVAAAGNDGPCTDCVLYPAAYSTVIAVSSLGMDDDLSSFSSSGPEVELIAPGTYIYSTVIDGYQYFSGTSMACPHVAAAGGHLMATGYSNTEARTRLRETAEDVGLPSTAQGYGLVDVEAALGSSDAPDTSITVTTDTATGITETEATLNGAVSDLGGAESATVSFDYRQQGASSWASTQGQTKSSTGGFTETVSGLESGVAYEFRAVATASDGDSDTGQISTFETTTDPSVVVSTGSATDVGETIVTLNGSLSDLGGAESATVSFDYRQGGTSSWTQTDTQTRSSTGAFSESLSGLESGVTYEFRAIATASDGDSDTGQISTFQTTVDPGVVVSTDSPTSVGESTATLNGTLSDLGGASSADVAFEWGERGSGFPNTTSGQSLSSTGAFSESVSGLASDTEYEFRAVATASDGDTDTASAIVFTTDATPSEPSEPSAPTVESYSVSEAGKRDPHAEITANWSVADVDGDLSAVAVDVLDSRGFVVASTRSSVSGGSATGSDTFKLKKVGSATFDVRVTVTDSGGRSAVQTASVTS